MSKPAVALDRFELVALFLLHAMAVQQPEATWNDLVAEAIDGTEVFLDGLNKLRGNGQ